MKKLFTDAEIILLNRNPNVHSANDHEIHYTNEFKLHFIRCYLAGQGPARIFADAGLPAELIGYKRIERAGYHWRRAYENGTLGKEAENSSRESAQQTLMYTITEQRKIIERLEKKVSKLKKHTKP